jgi:hypothetical protein
MKNISLPARQMGPAIIADGEQMANGSLEPIPKEKQPGRERPGCL